MAVPFFGFVLGSIVFSLLGLIVLRVSGVAPIRPLTIAAFVLAAFASTLAYAFAYARIFGDQTGELQSRAIVVIFLVGVPLIASLAGAVAARLAVMVFAQSKSTN